MKKDGTLVFTTFTSPLFNISRASQGSVGVSLLLRPHTLSLGYYCSVPGHCTGSRRSSKKDNQSRDLYRSSLLRSSLLFDRNYATLKIRKEYRRSRHRYSSLLSDSALLLVIFLSRSTLCCRHHHSTTRTNNRSTFIAFQPASFLCQSYKLSFSLSIDFFFQFNQTSVTFLLWLSFNYKKCTQTIRGEIYNFKINALHGDIIPPKEK